MYMLYLLSRPNLTMWFYTIIMHDHELARLTYTDALNKILVEILHIRLGPHDNAFTPLARMESVHVLCALVAQEGWHVHHMDVKFTFLNGDLKEEVYVCQPPGYAVATEEGKVCRLRKALYILR
jgi:hypothetical protein